MMLGLMVRVALALLVIATIPIPGVVFDLYPLALGVVLTAFSVGALFVGFRFGDWMVRRTYSK